MLVILYSERKREQKQQRKKAPRKGHQGTGI